MEQDSGWRGTADAGGGGQSDGAPGTKRAAAAHRQSAWQLSYEHRTVLILHEFEDLEYKEIAKRMQMFHRHGDVAVVLCAAENGSADGVVQTRGTILMKRELELKIQAHLDGELAGRESREITALLESDPEACNLFAQLQGVQTVIAAHEPVRALPETRAFYWSKIQRDIARHEQLAEHEIERISLWPKFRRRYMAVSGGLAAATVLLVATMANLNRVHPELLEEIENPLEHTGAFTFRSEAQKVTVVWLYRSQKDNQPERSESSELEDWM